MNRLAAATALAGCLAACASAGPRPQTGEISFRLTWSGRADVDLYVVSPLGDRVDFLRRESDSGGRLDVDCNYGELHCAQPMENIYWPRDGAPAGLYRYWAVLADRAAAEPTDLYRLEVRRGRRVVRRHVGPVSELGQAPHVHTVDVEGRL